MAFFLLYGRQQMFMDARKEVLYFIYFAFFFVCTEIQNKHKIHSLACFFFHLTERDGHMTIQQQQRQ